MRISLQVQVEGRYWTGAAGVEVPDLLRETFTPIDVCTDALTAMAVGGVTEVVARKVMIVRKDAAEILAKQLTELILSEMRKQDTANGYPE